MSRKSYNNIKKYAAFIFMVFTVLSGSSDRIDSGDFVKVGRKAFIDILVTNRLLMHEIRVSTGQLRSKSVTKWNEDFRDFLDSCMENSNLNDIQVYIFPLLIFIYFINNLILKNNIWKSAVF